LVANRIIATRKIPAPTPITQILYYLLNLEANVAAPNPRIVQKTRTKIRKFSVVLSYGKN